MSAHSLSTLMAFVSYSIHKDLVKLGRRFCLSCGMWSYFVELTGDSNMREEGTQFR